MRRSFVATSLASICLIAGLAGCNPAPNNGPTNTANPDSQVQTVTVGFLPMVSAITHYVAVDQGFYAKQGLKVEATKITTSNQLASQLADGKLDAAVELSLVPLLKTIKPGATKPAFKLFSASSVTADKSFDGIVVKQESTIRSVTDLSGKRVATFPGTTASASLTYAFQLIAPGKPIPVCKPTAPDLQLQALETGGVDALYCYEPTLSRAQSSGMRLLPKSGIYAFLQEGSPVGVAAVNTEFATSRADACKKLVAALDEAALYVRQHPKEARQILARAESVDAKVTGSMNDLNMGTSSEVRFETLQRFESLLQKMHEAGPMPLTKDYVYAP
ncbi:MAG: ABC transporter substrate-binding protein [Armatimonadetes bacterium]|nr:ABC transporter substrate-binding protein [Armatimonadota bacterium]